MGYTPPRSTPPRSRRRSSGMGRRRGHGVGDRPNGRRAGIRRDVLASNVNQAGSCLPPPVPRGGMQRSRCPPQPGRPPPARWPSVSGGRRKRQARPSREEHPRTPSACTRHARAPAVSLPLPCGRGGRRASAHPTARRAPSSVIPAKAGIHTRSARPSRAAFMDPGSSPG